jgi:EAL domain-containing protein (putative c-di-GMP-specific phosphodiesterase class I)
MTEAAPCPRCEVLPEINDGPVVLHMWPPLGHTSGKIRAAAKKAGCLVDAGNGVSAALQRGEMDDFLGVLGDVLTRGELEDTHCLTRVGDDAPSFDEFARVTTLARLAAMRGARWLLGVLSDKALDTMFQPIVARDAPHLPYAHECLLRWRTPDGGIGAPGPLFEAAGGAGLLFHLDRAARETHVRNAAKRSVGTRLFINFTPTSIYDPRNCLKSTLAVIDEVGLRRDQIVFEVIETERVDDVRHLKDILSYYQENGFRVALDDLGAGHATLQMLGQLLPDLVKLDMDLVRDVHQDRFKSELVRRIIGLAHEFGIEVVAEGIETAEEAAWLTSQKVDYMQGYYFAKPGPDPVDIVDRRA